MTDSQLLWISVPSWRVCARAVVMCMRECTIVVQACILQRIENVIQNNVGSGFFNPQIVKLQDDGGE